MGMFSAAIALLSSGGGFQQKELPERHSSRDVEIKSSILVIDDDPMLLQTARTLFIKRGFNVLTSSSVPRGLGVLRNAVGGIQVVLLNCGMLKLSGDESLKFVRQLRPNAKVIGLTAVNLESVPREHLDSVDKMLSKPVIASTLIATVDGLLGDAQTASSAIQS